jgi:hypothetical protein
MKITIIKIKITSEKKQMASDKLKENEKLTACSPAYTNSNSAPAEIVCCGAGTARCTRQSSRAHSHFPVNTPLTYSGHWEHT